MIVIFLIFSVRFVGHIFRVSHRRYKIAGRKRPGNTGVGAVGRKLYDIACIVDHISICVCPVTMHARLMNIAAVY